MPADHKRHILPHRRALRRSRISVEILLTLLEHGPLSLVDLARLVGADARNVHGALFGDETPKRTRYRTHQALVVLALVEQHELPSDVFYDLTPAGAIAAERLAADVDRRRGVRPRMRT